MRAYLQALGADVWEIVERGYQYPISIPTDTSGKNNNEKSKMLNEEIKIQPDQQTRKVNLQMKSFNTNYRNVNQFSPLTNNV